MRTVITRCDKYRSIILPSPEIGGNILIRNNGHDKVIITVCPHEHIDEEIIDTVSCELIDSSQRTRKV